MASLQREQLQRGHQPMSIQTRSRLAPQRGYLYCQLRWNES